MTTGIIMSGTYVQTGLIAEFGKIPPSFLPLGNRRLYWHQIAMLQSHCDQVFLTVPDDFELPQKDVVALAELGVQVLPSDRSRTIAEALLDGISSIPQLDGPLVVLYGDTLFSGQVALPSDFYSAHVAVDEYKWTPASMISGADAQYEPGLVVSGLYSFSSTKVLANALSICNDDIIEALKIYDQSLPLQMLSQGSWFDFGHAQTYYTSCGFITTQRSFNSLKITRQSVEKSSDDIQKMEAEASWFEALPPELRVYAPTFLGRIEIDGKTTGYCTQNTYLSTLANLSTFGRLNKNTWSSIFAACKEFLDETAQVAGSTQKPISLEGYYQPKTDARLKRFSDETGFDTTSAITINGFTAPSLVQMSRETGAIILASSAPSPTLIHGDFCFSNIFFDFRSRLVKVIDPRGIAPSGEITPFGDPRYDVAKLSHSALGRYDAIISGHVTAGQNGHHFTLNSGDLNTSTWQQIEEAFHEAGFLANNESRKVNHAIMVQLFLSMLPLHADHPDRQVAFLANAARLFLQMEE